MTPLISLERATKSFAWDGGRVPVLHEVGFSVAEGETVAVTGPSGSGKSTLLGLLAGLERPDSGRLLYKGRELTALSEEDLAAWRRTCVGFVFQSHRLVSSLTALENAMLPLELAGRGGAEARSRAFEALESLGLASRANHLPSRLSGGEQQRAAIARAFVHRPELVLADEPTGALDAESAAGVLESLLRLNAERGTALVVVTHNPDVAARLSRRAVLSKGRLA